MPKDTPLPSIQKYTTLSRGFTLVEMLAVIIVFIVVGSIMLSILVTSLRTSHKADIVDQVRENGNYAVTQVAKTIRDSRGLISPFPCVTPVVASSITVLTPQNDEITYDCTTPASPTPATLASNSASMLDTTVVAVNACSFTCTQKSASELPIIQINLSLVQQSTSKAVEQTTAPISFQTSTVMRNIIR